MALVLVVPCISGRCSITTLRLNSTRPGLPLQGSWLQGVWCLLQQIKIYGTMLGTISKLIVSGRFHLLNALGCRIQTQQRSLNYADYVIDSWQYCTYFQNSKKSYRSSQAKQPRTYEESSICYDFGNKHCPRGPLLNSPKNPKFPWDDQVLHPQFCSPYHQRSRKTDWCKFNPPPTRSLCRRALVLLCTVMLLVLSGCLIVNLVEMKLHNRKSFCQFAHPMMDCQATGRAVCYNE